MTWIIIVVVVAAAEAVSAWDTNSYLTCTKGR